MQATGDTNTCSGTLCGIFCTTPSSDPLNCGTCGTACTSGVPCTSGTCGSGGGGGGGCSPPQTLCNGTCTNTGTDPNNCGTCGNVCSTNQSCTNGQCVASCSAGQTLCGGACVNEQTDPNNCGACGKVCGSGQSCTAGVCTSTTGAVCGNGIREAGEQCDDGNTTNLDGCSSTCQFEQDQRVISLALQGTTDSFCARNILGTQAIPGIGLPCLMPTSAPVSRPVPPTNSLSSRG